MCEGMELLGWKAWNADTLHAEMKEEKQGEKLQTTRKLAEDNKQREHTAVELAKGEDVE